MKEKDFKPNFILFQEEVKQIHEPCFIHIDQWCLCGEPLNGVEIGYTIDAHCARKLLHYIGLKHGLLVLCPNDVIDIDVKDDKIIGSFIRSNCGKLRIKP